MKKITIFSILIISLVTVVAAGCASDTAGSGVQDVKTDENIEDNASQDQVTQSEQTAPVKGSFNNPATTGETVVIEATGQSYEVSVTEVQRGEKANYIVKNENEFNENPASGYEYLLVKTKVTYTKGEGPENLGSTEFKVFCDGVECTESWVVLPNDYIKFDSGDVMPGATKEGWIAYTVPTGKEAILSFQPNMFDENTAYISLGIIQ
ncbi:MAG: DUF4352 domain-containing protein [Methanosarcina vacuolata]|jgi:hypothetical protein|nr:DUF4352 domain-containing protein [Methanosarcina vacuolata]